MIQLVGEDAAVRLVSTDAMVLLVGDAGYQPAAVDELLLESGDWLLLEDGSRILLEV